MLITDKRPLIAQRTQTLMPNKALCEKQILLTLLLKSFRPELSEAVVLLVLGVHSLIKYLTHSLCLSLLYNGKLFTQSLSVNIWNMNETVVLKNIGNISVFDAFEPAVARPRQPQL